MPAFFTCVSKKFFVLQNCAAPENELFLRQNVPEKGSNTDVLQALRVHYRGKRAVSQAIYPYRASAYKQNKNYFSPWKVLFSMQRKEVFRWRPLWLPRKNDEAVREKSSSSGKASFP